MNSHVLTTAVMGQYLCVTGHFFCYLMPQMLQSETFNGKQFHSLMLCDFKVKADDSTAWDYL